MNHSVTIIQTKQLNDGEFAVLSQCCSDPTTNSWGTMAAATSSDPAKLQSFVDYHHSRIANLHQLSIESRAILDNLVGKTFIIEATVPDPTPAPVASPDPAPAQPTDPNAPSTPSDPSASSGTTPQ